MKKSCISLFLGVLERLFIRSNTLPAFLSLSSHCMQMLLYLFVIHDSATLIQIFPKVQSGLLPLIIILVVFLGFRLIRGVSFIKTLYPAFLCYAINIIVQQNLLFAIAVIFITLLLIVADLLSNISLSFQPAEIQPETINFCKILHCLLFIFGIVQATLWNNLYSFLACGVGFGVLALIKASSQMNSERLKEILMRFYLLLTFDHFTMALHSQLPLPLFLRFAIPVILSQFAYQVYSLKKASPKLQQLYSQEHYFLLSFDICKYISQNQFNLKFEQEIESFMGSEYQSCLKDSQRQRMIFDKLIALLSRKQSFENSVLMACIHIAEHKLLKARAIVESCKSQIKCDFIKKILLYRIEEMIEQEYFFQKSHTRFYYEKSHFQCDEFRSQLLKSATHHINFWQYSNRLEINPKKMREMADKLIDFQDKITQTYESIDQKCISLMLLYVSYLYEVVRDLKKARKILQGLSLKEEEQIYLQLTDKVFIRVKVQQEPFKIEKIGPNVSVLLGYERKDVQGQSISVFLPDFYGKIHQEVSLNMIMNNFEEVHVHNKKTIVKNKWNYYEECLVILRLHYEFGEGFVFQGFLRIQNSPEYIWKDYLLVNSKQEVLECSDHFCELAPTKTIVHHASQFFTGEINLKEINFNQQTQYFPLVLFREEDGGMTTYFVRTGISQHTGLAQLTNQRMADIINEVKKISLELVFVKRYFTSMKEVLKNIFSTENLVLFFVCILLLCGIFVTQFLFYSTMNSEQASQNEMINKTSDIIHYTNNYTQVRILLNYYDLNRQTNYSNNFLDANDMLQDSLQLSILNERLKDLSTDHYSIPSALLKNVNYSMSTYDITLQVISEAYMIQQFQDDSKLQDRILERFRKTEEPMSAKTSVNLRNLYLDKINSLPSQNFITNIVIISISSALFIALLLIIFRTQYKARVNEQETLSLVCNSRCQEELIFNVKSFVSKITKEEVRVINDGTFNMTSKMNKEETSFAPNLTSHGTDRENMKSQVSMRQLSNRNLMDQTLNKSMRGKGTKKEQENPGVPLQSTEIKLTNRRKRYILIPILVVLFILALLLMNLIKNNIVLTIDKKQSAQNILLQFRQSLNLSNRVNKFLTFLTLRSSGEAVAGSSYAVSDSDFNRVDTAVYFQQAKLSQFSLFQQMVVQLNYQYVCSYVQCDSRFTEEINIIYTSTIKKIFTEMNAVIAVLDPLDTSTFKGMLLNQDIKFKLDLIYYSEHIIRKILTNIIDMYDQCYFNYSMTLLRAKQSEVGLAVGFTVFGTILFVVMVLAFNRDQKYLQRIVDIFKIKDNYGELFDEDLKEEE